MGPNVRSHYEVKCRHGNLWPHYHLYVVGQHGVLCDVVVKICSVIRIKLNQLL